MKRALTNESEIKTFSDEEKLSENLLAKRFTQKKNQTKTAKDSSSNKRNGTR